MISTGSKSFITNLTQSQTAFGVGNRVRLSYTITPADFMEGIITAFSTTTMTVNIDYTGGSGVFAPWNITDLQEQ